MRALKNQKRIRSTCGAFITVWEGHYSIVDIVIIPNEGVMITTEIIAGF
jgi:hypothetical protein